MKLLKLNQLYDYKDLKSYIKSINNNILVKSMINIEKLQKESGIIGNSDEITQVVEMVGQVAPVDISVLVLGESGSGKEIIARSIHKASKRSNQPLIIVNCGAIP